MANPEKWDAGRKLDAEIAKIVGIETEWYHYKPKDCYRLVRKGWATNEWDAAMMEADVPSYSIRDGAALEVIYHLIDTGVGLPEMCFDGQLWVVTIRDFGKKAVVASAETLALAICRAAWLAVMEENDGS